MDQLSETQIAAIKKSSSDRIRLHLWKAGCPEDTVLGWSRDELLEQYAQWLVKVQPVAGAVAATSGGQDPTLERERWRHEERMKELEVELVRAKMQRDSQRAGLRQSGQPTTGIDSSDSSASVNRVEVMNETVSSDFSTDIESGDIFSLFAVNEPKSVSVDTLVASNAVDKHRVFANRESALHYVNIHVSDVHDNVACIDALFDSGAENYH